MPFDGQTLPMQSKLKRDFKALRSLLAWIRCAVRIAIAAGDCMREPVGIDDGSRRVTAGGDRNRAGGELPIVSRLVLNVFTATRATVGP